MANETFRVGEIAIMLSAWPEFHMTECEVIEGLAMRTGRLITGNSHTSLCYRVRRIDGKTHQCNPEHLRKRRPPQDWKTLCRLTDLPREVEHV